MTALAAAFSNKGTPKDLTHEHWIWEKQSLTPVTTTTIEQCCAAELEDHRGFHLYFLPRIQDNLEYDKDLCQLLSKTFFIPPWFWTRTAWNSNGFFVSMENESPKIGKIHCTYFRFLIKELVQSARTSYDGLPRYNWQFIAFVTLWFPAKGQAKNNQIVLCFDTSTTMKDVLMKNLKQFEPDSMNDCPFYIHTNIVEQVVQYFDDKLWGFQEPVRDIEKTRIPSTVQGQMQARYNNMRELSRHIIHKTETLGASTGVLEDIIASHTATCKNPLLDKHMRVQSQLRFHHLFICNLRIRAQAFADRLDNEIRLILHDSAAEILNEVKHESKDLVKFVTSLTLFLLPGTFLASFFGMNFFYLDETTKRFQTSPDIWLFFVIAVPVTIGCGLLYQKWQQVFGL